MKRIHIKRTGLFLCFFNIFLVLVNEGFAAITISHIQPQIVSSGQEITILGAGFTNGNGELQVIADYGNGLLYSLNIIKNDKKSVKFRIEDIGKNLHIKLKLLKGLESSNIKTVTLKPIIRADPVFPLRQHQLLVGDKGEDIFKVVNKAASCRQPGEIFDHAGIQFLQKRFAEAQFITLPEAGCTRCKDIRVRWYNEPTGVLRYQLIIYRRQIEGLCPQRIR